MKYDVYLKKLRTQELGYRKGRLMTGGYFYISKAAIGTFFKELNKFILNDFILLEFNDPLEPNKKIHATFVYHNDKFASEMGTRNEYRIYHNREIASHDLHFQPSEIVVFVKESEDKFRIEHYGKYHKNYNMLNELIVKSKFKGDHALFSAKDFLKYTSTES